MKREDLYLSFGTITITRTCKYGASTYKDFNNVVFTSYVHAHTIVRVRRTRTVPGSMDYCTTYSIVIANNII